MAAAPPPAARKVLPWYIQRLRGLYTIGVHHPERYVRLAAMATIGQVLALSTWRLHVRQAARTTSPPSRSALVQHSLSRPRCAAPQGAAAVGLHHVRPHAPAGLAAGAGDVPGQHVRRLCRLPAAGARAQRGAQGGRGGLRRCALRPPPAASPGGHAPATWRQQPLPACAPPRLPPQASSARTRWRRWWRWWRWTTGPAARPRTSTTSRSMCM